MKATKTETEKPTTGERHNEAADFNPASFDRRPTQAGDKPDPFDPKNLRLPTDFSGGTAVRKALTKVLCRKPNRHEFVRTRSGNAWRVETAVFEDKLTRGDLYMIDESLWLDLAADIHAVALYLATSRQGDVFLGPANSPALTVEPTIGTTPC